MIRILYSFQQYEDPELVATRLGLVMTCLLYSFFVMPIYAIFEAVKQKCTQHIPLAMCVTGTAVSFTWVLHGFIVKSLFIIVNIDLNRSHCSARMHDSHPLIQFQAQNLFILIVGVVQLSLFLIYPSHPAKKSDAASMKKNDDENSGGGRRKSKAKAKLT